MLNFEPFDEVKSYLIDAKWPEFTESWYYAGHEDSFKKGMFPIDLVNLKLMIFKDENGSLIAIERNCIHMHADLSKGVLKNGKIKCPMHGWNYDTKGKCLRIESKHQLKKYPLEIWMGHVFVYCGKDSNFFPFPKFDVSDDKLRMSRKTITIKSNTPWYLLAGNGFDLRHFYTVHHRELASEPIIKFNGHNRILTQLQYKNIGQHITDRILRFLYGDGLRLHYEVAGANLILAISKISKKNNYMFFSIQPKSKDESEVFLFFLKEKSALKLFDQVSLFIRRLFIKRFFQEEVDSIKELQLIPENFAEEDIFLMNYLKQTHQLSIRI
jgi:phenylpropionate dioxygenase-like ring-hydroxylating dioxygenase large terminal subunit